MRGIGPLRQNVGFRFARQLGGSGFKEWHKSLRELTPDGPLAHATYLRELHPICGKYTGEWMNEDAFDTQCIGNQTGVLSAGATKAVEGVIANVIPLGHRDALDGVRHVFDRNADETVRNLFRRTAVADL